MGIGVVPLMSNETEVAVLFADVVGSTRLYEVLGDRQARDTIMVCVEVMRGATERNRGSVIKTIGDEILAIFPTADDAVNAAAEMQHDIGVHPTLQMQGQHVAIRIGCLRSRYFCQCSQPPAPPTRAAMRTTRRSLAFSAAR